MGVRSNHIFRTNLLDQFEYYTVLCLHAGVQSLYAEKFKLLGHNMSVRGKKVIL